LEKKEDALTSKLKTVLKDKKKIASTIEELDKYKREALHKTWIKVNR
jgi:structural maintenance of chromosome 2